jgi:hypothetical protein
VGFAGCLEEPSERRQERARPHAHEHAKVLHTNVDTSARPSGHGVARRSRRVGVLQERNGTGLGGVVGELARHTRRQQLGYREHRRQEQRRDGDELDRCLAGVARARGT